MFRSAEVGAEVSKEEFAAQEPQLRVDLVNAQYDLKEADFPVIIVVVGNDRVGCNLLVDRLHEWLDARYIDTHIFGAPTEEERERPRFWRYWASLPAKGKIGLYGGAWPLNAVADRASGQLKKKEYAHRLQYMRQFERELAADGALILKFWVHLSQKEMKKRLKAARKDPDRVWWIEDVDWEIYERQDEVSEPIKQMIRETDSVVAPWIVVEGTDGRYRDLKVATTIRDSLQQRLESNGDKTAGGALPVESNEAHRAQTTAQAGDGREPNVLDGMDLSLSLDRGEYKEQLEKYQRKLHMLMRKAWDKRLTTVLAFEGSDAAGKGGAIRRITGALPAKCYNVVPIAAPTAEEQAHHYLWRFWRHLPHAGRMLIFDRTWYGRVMVERIEGFATEAEWRRAYDEINDFEEQLVRHGIPLLKFWLQISPDEQLRRFQAREQTPYKKYKITEEDYRNREKWDEYRQAVNEMVTRTSTDIAPWHLIAANSKRHARVSVLKTVCRALKDALD